MMKKITLSALIFLTCLPLSAQYPPERVLKLEDDSGKIFGNEEIMLVIPDAQKIIRAYPTDLNGNYKFIDEGYSGRKCYPIVPFRAGCVKISDTGVIPELPEVQYPRANSFDPACNFSIGRSFVLPENGNIAKISDFKGCFAPMLFIVKGLNTNEKILSASINGGNLKIKASWPAGLKSKAGAWRIFVLAKDLKLEAKSVSLTVETGNAFYTKDISLDSEQAPSTEKIFTQIAEMSGAKEKLKPSPVFAILNLNYPPLGKIKQFYDDGDYKNAEKALMAYFKSERKTVNPLMNPGLSKVYPDEIKIANDALPSSGYRFAVHNKSYVERMIGDTPVFYSFDDGKGGINWELSPEKAGSEFYQKHMHKWFIHLAKNYYVTKDEKYFFAWKKEFSDWLAKYPCPGKNGITYSGKTSSYGWKSWAPLTVASRLEIQETIFDYFLQSPAFDFKWMETFLTSVSDEVEFNRNNLYYEHSSNIYLAQIRSIFISGILFPEFKNAKDWTQEFGKAMSESFSLLFNEDGCLNELDALYHTGVVNNYLTAFEIAEANGKTALLADDFKDRLHNSCRFVMHYLYPNYLWECFNDTRQTTRNVAMRNLGNYARMFQDDKDLLYASTSGEEGKKPVSALAQYPVSGYYMFRSGWDENALMLIFKNNYNPKNKWHASNDNGTLGLYNKGRIFLPDAGSFTYGGGAGSELSRMREEFKATARHNTVTLDLKTIAGGEGKGRLLKACTDKNREMVVTENDSYPGLTHRRTVWMVDKCFFVVLDAIYGECKEGTLNLSWHLCDDPEKGPEIVSIDDNCMGANTLFTDGNNMSLRSFCNNNNATGEQGLSDYSTVLNRKSPRKYYRVNAPAGSEATRFITVIAPYSKSAPSISAQFSDGGFTQGGETITVNINGKKYQLNYTL